MFCGKHLSITDISFQKALITANFGLKTNATWHFGRKASVLSHHLLKTFHHDFNTIGFRFIHTNNQICAPKLLNSGLSLRHT